MPGLTHERNVTSCHVALPEQEEEQEETRPLLDRSCCFFFSFFLAKARSSVCSFFMNESRPRSRRTSAPVFASTTTRRTHDEMNSWSRPAPIGACKTGLGHTASWYSDRRPFYFSSKPFFSFLRSTPGTMMVGDRGGCGRAEIPSSPPRHERST
jgi:hypothetical protein